jgi:sugar phosphate isomerase/epimerase
VQRRTFLKSTLAASIVATHDAWSADAGRHVQPIGLQLYTVRAQAAKDLDGTLAQVRAAGYREVEMTSDLKQSAKEQRALLDRHGLTSPGVHIDYSVVESGLPQAMEKAHTLGQTYLTCPWIDESQRKSPGGWKKAADLFNKAGEQCHQSGFQFAYHNHTFEFHPEPALGGKLPYDFLLANTDPNLVKMELDLCWITVAGGDPVTYFKRYPGRFPLVHVKDWKGKGGDLDVMNQHLADVGQGSIDWKAIFAQSGPAGIKHYIVENDIAKSFEDVRISYQYLDTLRY